MKILSIDGQMPPLHIQVGGAIRAVSSELRAIVNQEPPVTEAEQERRFAICLRCEFFHDSRCVKCGCFMALKSRMRSQSCPVGKW